MCNDIDAGYPQGPENINSNQLIEPPFKLAQTLHLLLCKGNHGAEPTCRWYLEDQQVERWKQPSHKKWLEQAEGLVLMAQSSEENIVQLFEQLIPIITQLNFLRQKFGPLSEMIEIVLKETKEN